MEEAIGDYARRRRRDAFEKWECGNDRELWIPSKSSSQNSIILSFQQKKTKVPQRENQKPNNLKRNNTTKLFFSSSLCFCFFV